MTLLWVVNGLLFLVVIPAVVIIAQRVVRPALAVKRHADDILARRAAGVGAGQPA